MKAERSAGAFGNAAESMNGVLCGCSNKDIGLKGSRDVARVDCDVVVRSDWLS